VFPNRPQETPWRPGINGDIPDLLHMGTGLPRLNADTKPRKVSIDLAALGVKGQGSLIADGGDALGFKSETFPLERGALSAQIEMRTRGGSS
jgi:hypothetical protein